MALERQTLSLTQKDDGLQPGAARDAEPALYVLLEGERPLAGGLRVSLTEIDEVRIGRGRARSVEVSGRTAAIEVPDPRMSGAHARIVRGDRGQLLLEDVGSTNGTFVAGARIRTHVIEGEQVFVLGATAFCYAPEEPIIKGTPRALESSARTSRPRGMCTLVPGYEDAMPRLVRVAMSSLPILLLGPSGSGKEVLARSVHELSGREGAFVAINCGALAPNLVESLLFGHVRGAFSGALRDELGLVRAAHRGTLFLDEIGELPAAAQATLLRVLQEKEVLPVGATKPVSVDLRVISATLRPIEASSTFRADLYARVAAFVFRVPSLRERRGDLGMLVADLLPRLTPDRAAQLRMAPDLVAALAAHDWPLNVRELEHVLSVATVTSSSEQLKLDDVGEALRARRDDGAAEQPASVSSVKPSRMPAVRDDADDERDSTRPLTEADLKIKEDLVAALTKTNGNVSEVSRILGKTRMQIHRWAKRFAIDLESFRRT